VLRCTRGGGAIEVWPFSLLPDLFYRLRVFQQRAFWGRVNQLRGVCKPLRLDEAGSDVGGALVGKIRELQGSRLRRYREAAGLSQGEVAERLGVSKMAVSKWEAANDPGDRWPDLARLYEIGESYPGAPFNPQRRRAWLQERGAGLCAVGSRDAAVSSRRS
jgi:DNA-binding XRE family transcriptional regulator